MILSFAASRSPKGFEAEGDANLLLSAGDIYSIRGASTRLLEMAAIRPIWASPLPHLFIRAIPSLSVFQSSTSSRLLQYLPRSFALSSKTIAPGAIVLGLPSILSGLWESILRAVPKKKTSHMKKRHRQMAGKALKDVKNMTNCPGCGQPKRAHLLCPTCVSEVKQRWREEEKPAISA
ncbi:hypothetical protein DIZ76_013807 [Coccidioides immitis]|nr:hypothetical protein DIZ76_013807 [Coccidioides immitis]